MFSIKSGNGTTNENQSVSFKVPNTTVTYQNYPVTLMKIDPDTQTPIYDAEFSISVYKNKKDGKYYKYGTVDNGTPQYDMQWAETKKIQQIVVDNELTNTFRRIIYLQEEHIGLKKQKDLQDMQQTVDIGALVMACRECFIL